MNTFCAIVFIGIALAGPVVAPNGGPLISYEDNKCSCPGHVGPTGSEWVGSCSAQCPTDMTPTCSCEPAKNSCTCEKK